MNSSNIIKFLNTLNKENPSDYQDDLTALLQRNIDATTAYMEQLKEKAEFSTIKELQEYIGEDESNIGKYISLTSQLLIQLADTLLTEDELLSVKETKSLNNSLKNLIEIGLSSNLLNNMPTYRQLPASHKDDYSILNQYKILAGTTNILMSCMNSPKLRIVILSGFYKPLLSSLYQIIYCPLKKPSDSGTCQFVMTQDVYDWLLKEKLKFKKWLDYLSKTSYRNHYVHQTMLLVTPSSPIWLKKAVSRNLNEILLSKNGIKVIAWAMVHADLSNDRTKNWKSLEILEKLISNFYRTAEFKNLSEQLFDLINESIKETDCNIISVYDDLYCLCTKRLYLVDMNLCNQTLLLHILENLKKFCLNDQSFSNNEDVTSLIKHTIGLLHNCLIGKTLQTPDLPITILEPYINVLFNLYTLATDSSQNLIKNQLEELLIKYLKYSKSDENFDYFLFNLPNDGIFMLRRNMFIEFRGNSIFVKLFENKTRINIGKKADVVLKLCRKNEDLYIALFKYYLKVLRDKNNYFSLNTNKDLLHLESEITFDEVTERKLMVFQNLSMLAEDTLIQEYINEKPKSIIDFLNDSLQKLLKSETHKSLDYESDEFQTNFTIIMILQALLLNSAKENLIHYKPLSDVVYTLFCQTLNLELKQLLKSIVEILCEEKFTPKHKKSHAKSELEKAIEDVCDPLLPVRGHGLLMLSKLIENKDKEAMERKNYILNIFQQNLKNDDSFIYLTAIGGLASMGNVFPDTILKILTEEYMDFTKKSEEDGSEIRMKLGEILVRVTKCLGEIAPKYKSLLLNTFLMGTKDEDHLIRASSLSNLGEICKVLGYKLGTIVTEVLVCVHSIITTDKSIEARRAAVTVIRHLLVGLETEMIVFLKDEMLEIYRSLKNIYHNDKDDIMRLQAQLALEELNDNVKNALFPSPTLHTEKKVIVLN